MESDSKEGGQIYLHAVHFQQLATSWAGERIGHLNVTLLDEQGHVTNGAIAIRAIGVDRAVQFGSATKSLPTVTRGFKKGSSLLVSSPDWRRCLPSRGTRSSHPTRISS